MSMSILLAISNYFKSTAVRTKEAQTTKQIDRDISECVRAEEENIAAANQLEQSIADIQLQIKYKTTLSKNLKKNAMKFLNIDNLLKKYVLYLSLLDFKTKRNLLQNEEETNSIISEKDLGKMDEFLLSLGVNDLFNDDVDSTIRRIFDFQNQRSSDKTKLLQYNKIEAILRKYHCHHKIKSIHEVAQYFIDDDQQKIAELLKESKQKDLLSEAARNKLSAMEQQVGVELELLTDKLAALQHELEPIHARFVLINHSIKTTLEAAAKVLQTLSSEASASGSPDVSERCAQRVKVFGAVEDYSSIQKKCVTAAPPGDRKSLRKQSSASLLRKGLRSPDRVARYASEQTLVLQDQTESFLLQTEKEKLITSVKAFKEAPTDVKRQKNFLKLANDIKKHLEAHGQQDTPLCKQLILMVQIRQLNQSISVEQLSTLKKLLKQSIEEDQQQPTVHLEQAHTAC